MIKGGQFMRHAWNAYKDELIGRLPFLRETLNTGVSEADISAAEQVIGVSFPESLKALYLDSNGDNEEAACGMIMGFHFLTLDELVSECQHWSGIAQDKALNDAGRLLIKAGGLYKVPLCQPEVDTDMCRRRRKLPRR